MESFQALLDEVKRIAGKKLDDKTAGDIVLAVITKAKLGPKNDLTYPKCTHVSKDMLEHYGRNGLCGICIHETNKQLAAAKEHLEQGGIEKLGVLGGAMIGGLMEIALTQRLLSIIQKYAGCEKCGTPLLESKRHGCVQCRGDRSWLSKITKKEKK